MRPVKEFEYYLKQKIVKKQGPDKSRSKSLELDAEKSKEFLYEIIKKIGITKNNSNNIIVLAYDIIMKLVRAKMFLNGFNASGQGAHEAEVSYLRKMNVSEKNIQFCDQLRYFRNGILYYGKKYEPLYAQKVVDFIQEIEKNT